MKYNYRRLYEDDAPQAQQPQPAQQPAQNQAQQQQAPQITEQDINTLRANIAKQVSDALNKALETEMNGSSNIAKLVKSNAEVSQYVKAILDKNDDFTAKMEMMKKFFETLAKPGQQPAQNQAQPQQQPQQQVQQPAQQNESFISKYQRKLFENYHTKNMMR